MKPVESSSFPRSCLPRWLHHVHEHKFERAEEAAARLAAAQRTDPSSMLRLLAVQRLASLAGEPDWPFGLGAAGQRCHAEVDKNAALVGLQVGQAPQV